MHDHRATKADGLLFGALACLMVGIVLVTQCVKHRPQPPPATVSVTPLATVVVVGPTQAAVTSTPRATATRVLPPSGRGGLLNR
jgi:hypothetical protein